MDFVKLFTISEIPVKYNRDNIYNNCGMYKRFKFIVECTLLSAVKNHRREIDRGITDKERRSYPS